MKITKIREVKTPTRGTECSAGLDFYALIAMNRSSVATSTDAMRRVGLTPKANTPKGTLVVGACVVDEDYQGEIYIHLINVGRSIEVIHPGMKVAQFVLTPVSYEGVEVVDEEELFNQATERGKGGFGSTNNGLI